MEITKKKPRRTLAGKHSKEASALRFAKEQTSSGQAQALWAFFVAVGVVIILFFSLHQPKRWYAGTEVPKAAVEPIAPQQNLTPSQAVDIEALLPPNEQPPAASSDPTLTH
ncbi:MAG: hypothetical protein AB7P04_06325 [Bacteriovoracia bacterium]